MGFGFVSLGSCPVEVHVCNRCCIGTRMRTCVRKQPALSCLSFPVPCASKGEPASLPLRCRGPGAALPFLGAAGGTGKAAPARPGAQLCPGSRAQHTTSPVLTAGDGTSGVEVVWELLPARCCLPPTQLPTANGAVGGTYPALQPPTASQPWGDQRGGCPPAVLGGKDAAPPCQGALPGLKRWLGEGFLPWCHLSLLLF